MASLKWAIVALACASAVAAQKEVGTSTSPRIYFRAAGKVQNDEVKKALDIELAARDERMTMIEGRFRTLFSSMPKNKFGNLDHSAVRYALHRFFLNEHGWFIRGLEPKEWRPENNDTFEKEWVPGFLQEVLDKHDQYRGASLHDVAAVSAALEDLVQTEAKARLTMAFQAHEIDPAIVLSRNQVEDVLLTYYMSFLIANKFTVGSIRELRAKKEMFIRRYKNYTEAHTWFEEMLARHLAPLEKERGFDFNSATRVVTEIGKNYSSFNQRECSALKSTLQGMEGRRPGRVRLSVFYNKSRYSHWRLTEKADYLRMLGALDDTDPKQPSVIIPNYVMSRSNCLDAFHLYSICCRNPCEELMNTLEQKIGAPRASPERIAGIISELPSESVEAPRTLPSTLLDRLQEVADHHGGKVPLHGRLFGQWMHHAYPMDCPYPHEQGTINPQTAFEWIQQTGQESTSATEEEIQKQVEQDMCAIDTEGNTDCEDEVTDLPWSMVELLVSQPDIALAGAASEEPAARPMHFTLLKVAFVALALLVFMIGAFAYTRVAASCTPEQSHHVVIDLSKRRGLMNCAKFGALFSLLVLAYCVDLLNSATLVGALLFTVAAGFRGMMTARFADARTRSKIFEEEVKCV